MLEDEQILLLNDGMPNDLFDSLFLVFIVFC